MQPSLRQFEVFLAVAKAGSFRAAAEAMHLSQPALSQHVAEMERELGTRLFDRLGRKIALTEAGRILEEHALRLFASLASAREAVADLSGLKRGSLVIGASTTPGIYVLPGIIAAFQKKYPGVALSLRIDNSTLIEEQIRGNEVDLGVVGGHALRLGEDCVAAGLLDELVLIVPPGHPWAGRREIQPARLRDQRLLIREEGSATRQLTERALQQAGGSITASMELGHRSDQAGGHGRAGSGLRRSTPFRRAGCRPVARAVSRGACIRRHSIIHNEARVDGARPSAFKTARPVRRKT
jgi:DNA-binding transcriptional LysR family regulator